MKGSRFLCCCLVVSNLLLQICPPAHAQSTWVDGAGDDKWSSTSNWSTNASPTGTIVIFNETGIAANSTTVSSIVDGTYTISGLSFSHATGTTFYHRLQLANELTISSALTTGDVFSVLSNQLSGSHGVSFTGGGSLVINASGQNFLVQNSNTGGANTMNLDLSGIASFTATVNQFNVGYGSNQTKVNFTLSANSNTITANTMRFGANYGNGGGTNTVKLGKTNTFNANTIIIAAARASTTVSVQAGVTNPTWAIRGTSGGVSRSDLILGINGSAYGANSGGSSASTANVNLTGVSVDFLLDELVLGVAGSVASDRIGHGNGNLTVAQGTVDAKSVTIGRALNITSQAINYTGTNGDYTGATTHGTLNITGGIFTAGSVTIAENLDGFGSDPTNATAGVNVNAAIKGALNISGGTTFITGDLTLATRTNATPSSGRTEGIATLTGGFVTVGGNIKEGTSGGYANNLSTLTLNGAVLDLTNGSIKVDTLNLQSGVLRNVSEINDGAGWSKTGAGTLVLGGTNAFSGAVSVNAGRLVVASSSGFGSSSTVSVANPAAFDHAPGAGQVLTLTSLSLAGGSTIGAELKEGSINVTGTGSSTGTIKVDVFGIPGMNYTNGAYHIVTGSGFDVVGAVYQTGSFYNTTNFGVNGVGADASGIFANVSTATELTDAYWFGGFTGATNVWAVSDGGGASGHSNWVTGINATGNNTGLVPGMNTNTIFSANSATNQSSMTLGANMTLGSLTFNDSAAILLSDMSYALTLAKATAITVNSGAGLVKLNTDLSFGTDGAAVDVDAASSGLEFGLIVSGANGFTKTGDGTLTLSGTLDNTLSGTIAVHGGLLLLNKLTGTDAISAGLSIGDGSGTDTVRLMALDQISDSSVVSVNAGGVLDLNDRTETIGGLGGTGGVVTNSGTGSVILNVGGNNVSASSGTVIQDGSGQLSLTKTGSGTQTLSGTQTYTGLTTVSAGTLALGANDVFSGTILVSGATAVLDVASFTDTVSLVTLVNGGTIGGGTGSLSSTSNFDLRDGTVSGRLAGSTGIDKTTTGTVTITSTASTYSGTTNILQGTLAMGAVNALPLGGNVTLGNGTTVGTLDLNTFDQTMGALQINFGTGNQIVIDAGATLTQTGGLIFGAAATGSGTFTATGGGAWVIDAATQNVEIRNTVTGNGTLTFDVAGLQSFNANVKEFNLGFSSVSQTITKTKLAQNNTITANIIRIGAGSGTGTLTGTKMELGLTNVINANSILVGQARTTSDLVFQTGLSGTPALVIRAQDGVGRTDLTLGANTTTTFVNGASVGGSSSPHGRVDLRGGYVDMLLDDMILGVASQVDPGNGFGYGLATFSFNQGIIDANNVIVARTLNSDQAQTVMGGAWPGGNANINHATLNVEGGTLRAGTVVIADNQDGTVGINGNSTGTMNVTGGTLDVAGDIIIARHTAGSPSTGYAKGTLNLTGGVVTVQGNLAEGATGDNQSTLTLNGATLDLTGGNIQVDTFNAQSGILRNVAEINGGAGLTKTTAGTLTLEGANSFTGGLTVSAGRVFDTANTALAASNSVSVSSGATFDYASGAGDVLTLGALNLVDGSSIGAELKNGSINVTGASSVSGTIKVNLFALPGMSAGTYHIVTGSGLDGGTSYQKGVFYNLTDIAIDSVGADTTGIYVNASTATELTTAYWHGGFSGAVNVWAVSDGGGASGNSNWVTDINPVGNNTGLVPGANTSVIFSANSAGNQTSMVLGADMSVGTLTFNDAAAVALNDPDYQLTLNGANAITVSNGAGAVSLNVHLLLNGAAPALSVDAGSAGLTLGGIVSGADAFTKSGGGTLVFTGVEANDYSGQASVTEGTLVLDKDNGVTAITGDLVVGDGSGTDTVRLQSLEQIADDADLTLNSSGVLDLAGQTETLGGVSGTGRITNSSTLAATLAVGAGDESSSFSGLIEDGTGMLSLIKTGDGTLTLSGSHTFSGSLSVLSGTLSVAAVNNAVVSGVFGNSTQAIQLGSNGKTATLQYTGATASTDRDFSLASGGTGVIEITSSATELTLSGSIGGTGNFAKIGPGTLILASANDYTGSTFIEQGEVVVGADGALPDGTDVIFGSTDPAVPGTLAVTLDLSAHSATIGDLKVFVNSSSVTSNVVIGAAQSLNISGAVLIGPNVTGTNTATKLTFSGGGTLNVGSGAVPTNAGFQIGGSTVDGKGNAVTLDMSGLSHFNAYLGTGTFFVGDAADSGGGGSGNVTFTMATDNFINAQRFSTDNAHYTNTTLVNLGTGANIIQADTVTIGISDGRGAGTFGFAAGNTTGTLTIRAQDGVSRAAMTVAYAVTAGTGAGPAQTADFRNHTTDLLLSDLKIGGRLAGTGANNTTGTFHFNQGTLDVTKVTIGDKSGGGTATVTGNFNISGGTVKIGAGGIAMASNTTSTGASAVANVYFTGGTITIDGDVVRTGATSGGASTANVKVGGTVDLDMKGHDIGDASNAVALTVEGGTLRNVGEINGGGAVTKTTTGSLVLDGTNTFTGSTAVDAGSWFVNGAHSGGAGYAISANATLGGMGFVTVAGGNDITIATNGKLSVGDATPAAATLSLDTTSGGALVFQDNSSLEMDLFSANTGGLNVSDLLNLDGTLTIGSNVSLNVINSTSLPTTAWQDGDTWQLFDWSGVSLRTGTFSTVLPDLTGTGLTWDLGDLYTGGAISVVLVPEPGRMSLLLLAAAIFALRRRRRSQD
ncbi:MAG: autotransporter-associated beta strand repeat-containing protein [Prosthecobacter sp.]|jgi:autotransporter-associated beta strand protein|uniref:beta strand repeat-containing protein n=1 Tax=Prosthecobacter sp. TaxID=1965333 RepID=UPI001A0B7FE7|nr:autotransporter-associated beta strand repeat-containing protein [Prosthecobacter sp.]MBE2282926.1 autotransporter-associated beta strand repeat-containing protein [Prosthecobacter sp.]